ncbi:hypothetical protein [Spirochaeta cellobiosiphila]|uniref:hypothetical protein n=1 Tax=Spirochaeta cellobiosiphila TaxID=504483 RepID=UPI000425CFE5|nr:hypothetical protein [Spirochaeta cellobiosiphila]
MKKVGFVILISFILMSCSESFQRNVKTFTSEYAGGLNRTVSVYSANGELISQYKGKIDVQTNEYGNKVLFDLNGKRVIIYNALVVVEEN